MDPLKSGVRRGDASCLRLNVYLSTFLTLKESKNSFTTGDSATAQGNRCSNCVFNAGCTHADLIKRRGSKPSHTRDPPSAASSSKRHGPDLRHVSVANSYVHSLERRVNQLERILKELSPDVNLPKETAGRETPAEHLPTSMYASISRQGSQSPEITEPEEDFSHPDLMKSLKRLSHHHFENFSQRYFGRSSSLTLFTDVISITKKSMDNENMVQFREHFDLQPWERATADAETPRYVYPDNDFIRSLVAIYFETINPINPILHRPTFEKHIDDGLHLQDHNFGAALLLVLAVASRYSNDPRVLASPSSKVSSGWKFFEQVCIFKKVVYAPPCLYELQVAVTKAGRIQFHSRRRAQEAIVLVHVPPFKLVSMQDVDEYGAIVAMDRHIGLYIGYPAMRNLELPVECDDENWEIAPEGQLHFNQPPGEPTKISYFIASIKLSEIMSVVMKTLYPIKKARNMLGLTGKIRWDPKCDNAIFLYQSAALYSIYYMLQILIHRPFLRTDSPLSMPSLIIFTNVAKSCTGILEVHMARIRTVNPQIVMGAFTSGAVFAMNIWSSKRAGHAPNAKDLASFEVCLATFEYATDTARSILFKAMASVEPASIWSSYDTVPQTALFQSGEQVYWDDYLTSQLGADLPLYRTNEPHLGFSSLAQPPYLNTESGLSGATIDMISFLACLLVSVFLVTALINALATSIFSGYGSRRIKIRVGDGDGSGENHHLSMSKESKRERL
ncbi:hypothetical protein DFS33DRAFT_1454515 [Desarmillaria ectypa]|nr:hypothetical protein DFS33DRAFT_1454515 [Desarmillaria ectypa]